MKLRTKLLALAAVAAVTLSGCGRGNDATASSDPGITKDEIKLAASFPYSGPATAYSVIPDAMKAYFESVNAAGGVDGRKISFETVDDGYDATRTTQAVRKFVEKDQVFAIAGLLGTGPNLAVMDYLNKKKVPQLFVTTGANAFSDDTAGNPWTINFPPAYAVEGAVYGQYLAENKPDAKVAVLYQSDDLGTDLLTAFEGAVKDSNIKIVEKQSYALTDASVASQATKLAKSGADTLVLFTTPKAALQMLTTARDLRWNPLRIINTSSNSIPGLIEPFGLADSKGIVGASYLRDPSDPEMKDTPEVKEYLANMAKYAPKDDPNNQLALIGYSEAQAIVEALKGMKEPTRQALMDSARSLNTTLPMLSPGIELVTSATDGRAVEALQIKIFDGQRFVSQGDPISPGN